MEIKIKDIIEDVESLQTEINVSNPDFESLVNPSTIEIMNLYLRIKQSEHLIKISNALESISRQLNNHSFNL